METISVNYSMEDLVKHMENYYTKIGNTDSGVIRQIEVLAVTLDESKFEDKETVELILRLKNIKEIKDIYGGVLINAMQNDKLTVMYQPVVDIMDMKIVGVEALVRWVAPNGKIINPISFIPFAEDNGLIEDICKIVMKKAFIQNKKWEQDGYSIKTSVNISGVQIDSAKLQVNVIRCMEDTGITKDNIILEITESATFETDNIKNLTKLGLDIYIDDFGTQYSHLNRLKDINATGIKIDKDFIDNIKDNKSYEIVKHTIELAHKLGMYVVAEGVETTEQKDILQKANCDFIQGYLVSKPVTGEDITNMLKIEKDVFEMEQEFIEMDEMVSKEYRKMFVRLPPEKTINERIIQAINNGIPIEYLVHAEIITKDQVGTLEIEKEVKDKIKAYMKHIGK